MLYLLSLSALFLADHIRLQIAVKSRDLVSVYSAITDGSIPYGRPAYFTIYSSLSYMYSPARKLGILSQNLIRISVEISIRGLF